MRQFQVRATVSQPVLDPTLRVHDENLRINPLQGLAA